MKNCSSVSITDALTWCPFHLNSLSITFDTCCVARLVFPRPNIIVHYLTMYLYPFHCNITLPLTWCPVSQ